MGETRLLPPECGVPTVCDGDCLCAVADEALCMKGTCTAFDFKLK
jgi:hypothetical protein